MGSDVPENLMERFSEFIEARAGLHYPRARWPDLERWLRSIASELGFQESEECARWLLSARAEKEQIERFVSLLTVGETYFFRDKAAFEVFETKVLRELILARRTSTKRLRIWSAGCCSGEEAYSIAIAVSRVLPDLADWDVTILGTDINPRFLKKAEDGIYSQWSFRATPDEMKSRFFRRVSRGHFEVLPAIRKLVSFACLNLVEDRSPSLLYHTNAMDVIFCRNVLMYFSRAQAKKVVANLHRSLVMGGWLFPSGSEASREMFAPFKQAAIPETIVYQKVPRALPEPPAGTLDRPASAPGRSGGHSRLPPPAPKAPQPEPLPAKPPSGLAEVARELANQGRLDEALETCDEALKIDKLSPAHHYLRGMILDEMGLREDAAAALRRALYLDDQFVLAHFGLGTLMRRQGRPRIAKRSFENARALLRASGPDFLLPESDGLTAGRLLAILDATEIRD